MSKCKICDEDKPLTSYYSSNKSTCKECVKARARSSRWANIDQVRLYDRERGNRQSPEYLKNYRGENPKKYKATNMVNNAIRDKKLFSEPCFCGEEKTVAHHDDYDKPLNVRWLCQAHHKQWHAANGPGANG